MTGKNRIMIYGPKDDGTYVIEFRTAAGTEAFPQHNRNLELPCFLDGAVFV